MAFKFPNKRINWKLYLYKHRGVGMIVLNFAKFVRKHQDGHQNNTACTTPPKAYSFFLYNGKYEHCFYWKIQNNFRGRTWYDFSGKSHGIIRLSNVILNHTFIL